MWIGKKGELLLIFPKLWWLWYFNDINVILFAIAFKIVKVQVWGLFTSMTWEQVQNLVSFLSLWYRKQTALLALVTELQNCINQNYTCKKHFKGLTFVMTKGSKFPSFEHVVHNNSVSELQVQVFKLYR